MTSVANRWTAACYLAVLGYIRLSKEHFPRPSCRSVLLWGARLRDRAQNDVAEDWTTWSPLNLSVQTVPEPPSRQHRHQSPSEDVQRRATSPADPPSVRLGRRRCCRTVPLPLIVVACSAAAAAPIWVHFFFIFLLLLSYLLLSYSSLVPRRFTVPLGLFIYSVKTVTNCCYFLPIVVSVLHYCISLHSYFALSKLFLFTHRVIYLNLRGLKGWEERRS